VTRQNILPVKTDHDVLLEKVQKLVPHVGGDLLVRLRRVDPITVEIVVFLRHFRDVLDGFVLQFAVDLGGERLDALEEISSDHFAPHSVQRDELGHQLIGVGVGLSQVEVALRSSRICRFRLAQRTSGMGARFTFDA
jgi:hypothetical protein